ncbi:hypothetical protein CDD83_529 [Cordyceps sp. RAO-2017]|nr:hypothetical protein CDD83_529 [Cordyceps sp. RAO-2017]
MAFPSTADDPAHNEYGSQSTTSPLLTHAAIHCWPRHGSPSASACMYFGFRECPSAMSAVKPHPDPARTSFSPSSSSTTIVLDEFVIVDGSNSSWKPSRRIDPPAWTMVDSSFVRSCSGWSDCDDRANAMFSNRRRPRWLEPTLWRNDRHDREKTVLLSKAEAGGEWCSSSVESESSFNDRLDALATLDSGCGDSDSRAARSARLRRFLLLADEGT